MNIPPSVADEDEFYRAILIGESNPELYGGFVGPPFIDRGDGTSIAACPISGRTGKAEPTDVRLLAACRSFAPLAVHARRGCLALGLPLEYEGWVSERLNRLATAGLLVSSHHVTALLARGPAQRAAPVTFVGIPTHNRPDLLKRCVTDLVRSAEAAYRTVELVVADGSADADMQEANRQALLGVRDAHSGGLSYIGEIARERYAAAMIESGADPLAVRIAILPAAGLFAAGANRNLLTLHATGHTLLQLDDDTLSRTAIAPSADPHLAFTSRPDPTEFWPLSGKLEPDPHGGPIDLVGIHESLLGRGLNELTATSPVGLPDLTGVDAAFLVRLQTAGGTVRVTTAGVAGDPGTGPSPYYLMLDGPSRERVYRSEAGYRAMLGGGGAIRTVNRPTVTSGSVCMGLNLGLDLRTLLPPFSPALRNEDGVFGALVQTCCPGAFMGHLPPAVWHLPPDGPRSYTIDSLVQAADGVRAEHLFIAMVRVCAPTVPSLDIRRNLRIVGEGLAGLGGLPTDKFRAFVRATAWELAAGLADRLRRLLDEYHGEPGWWAADVRRVLERLGEWTTGERFAQPLGQEKGGVDPVVQLQEVVASFGHLLVHWHELTEVAAALRAKGITPANAV